MGEPAGIGPEVETAAFAALGGRIGKRALLLVGDAKVLASCGAIPPDAIVQTKARATRKPVKADAANAAATVEAITLAVEMTMQGKACAVTTAPINKAVLMNTGIAGARDPLLMAEAMRDAVIAGRKAFLAGRIPRRLHAAASCAGGWPMRSRSAWH